MATWMALWRSGFSTVPQKDRTLEIMCWSWLVALMRFHLQNLNKAEHITSELEQTSQYIKGWRCTFIAPLVPREPSFLILFSAVCLNWQQHYLIDGTAKKKKKKRRQCHLLTYSARPESKEHAGRARDGGTSFSAYQNSVIAIVFFIMIKEYCQARLQKFVVTSLYFECSSKKTTNEKGMCRIRRKKVKYSLRIFFSLMPQTGER